MFITFPSTFQFILFASLAAAVSAGFPHQTVHQHAPSSIQSAPHYVVRENDHPTSYKPASLNHEEDIRRQPEIRRTDKVRGQYRLVDPDGKLRLINYQADQRPRYNVPTHQPHRRPTEAREAQQPAHRFYPKPVQASNLHTVAVAESPVAHRHHAAQVESRNPRYHSIPAIHSTRHDAPVSYITISQLLPASYYGQKKVYTTSHASQHPY